MAGEAVSKEPEYVLADAGVEVQAAPAARFQEAPRQEVWKQAQT